jgi:undecaprenyl-diphosphatase
MQTFIDGSSAALHSFAVAHPWVAPLVVWGTAGFLIVCPVGFFGLWIWDGRLRPGVAALVGLGITQWVCREAGQLMYRSRPFVALHFAPLYPHAPNNSFPSSLTAFAAVAAMVGVLAWGRLGLVFVASMIVVGFGCVYVGVHYTTDVIAGAALGAVCGAITWLTAGLPPVARALGALERRLPPGRRYQRAGRVAARAAS